MPRKQVVRRLPALPKISPLKAKEHKTERLIAVLESLAHTLQEERPRAFYAMRDVSNHFRVPISLVSRVYKRLEQEGLVKRIRGSKTMLRGLKYDRKLTVRGFVGLPAATSKLVTIQDYRMFLMSLRRELRLNGFAAATLDIARHEAEDFVERVKKYEIDTILWFQPNNLAKQAIPRLGDLGLRVVGVSDAAKPLIPCCYEIHRETAIRDIVRAWRADARIKSAIVISGGSRNSTVDGANFGQILETEDLPYEFWTAKSESVPKFLKALGHKADIGVAFLSSAASMFAFRSPEIVTRIFERCRVALIEGPVNMPFADVPPVHVDLVTIDWNAVARRIVNDLIAQVAFSDGNSVIFEAEAKLQVPLSNYAQVI